MQMAYWQIYEYEYEHEETLAYIQRRPTVCSSLYSCIIIIIADFYAVNKLNQSIKQAKLLTESCSNTLQQNNRNVVMNKPLNYSMCIYEIMPS